MNNFLIRNVEVEMLIFVILLLVIAMCFSLFNYWFQKDKYKRLAKEEIKKLNPLNSPSYWLAYFIVTFVATLSIITYYIYKLYMQILKLS